MFFPKMEGCYLVATNHNTQCIKFGKTSELFLLFSEYVKSLPKKFPNIKPSDGFNTIYFKCLN